jgi:carboxylate/amino acid/amine transporter
MFTLLVVSVIWAFSFGLIKGNLTGVDSNFVAFARLFIAALVFLPFIKWKKIQSKTAIKLALTGLVQFGMMYIAYLAAFRTLKAYEVALFTIFTPIFVTLINDAFMKHINLLHLAVALITVAGTAIIEWESIQSPAVWNGFLLVQLSNLCYAFGQIYYRRLMAQHPEVKDQDVFGYLYLGATVITAVAMLFTTPFNSLELHSKQVFTLLYLGVVASGVAFFLWNIGARRVNAGALAVFNDLKIPLAVAVSLLVFGESANLPRLLIGGGIVIGALVINEWLSKRNLVKITG